MTCPVIFRTYRRLICKYLHNSRLAFGNFAHWWWWYQSRPQGTAVVGSPPVRADVWVTGPALGGG